MSIVSLRGLLAQPALSSDREFALSRAARAGDAEARDQLICASLRLVALRVSNLRIPVNDVDDALQAGTVGLIAAVDRFDPDHGVRLATYAWPWITSAVRSAVRVGPETSSDDSPPPVQDTVGDLDRLVARLPIRLAEVIRLRFRLGEVDSVPRTRADVAARLGLTIGQVRWAEARALGQLRVSLARLGDRNPL